MEFGGDSRLVLGYVGRDYNGRSPQETESFFQAWLYFGFLSEFFKTAGLNIQMSDFVRKDSKGKRFVTTGRLRGLTKDWKANENQRRATQTSPTASSWDQARKARLDSLVLTLRYLKQLIHLFGAEENRNLINPKQDPPEFWPMRAEISMSILALGYSLAVALCEIHQVEQSQDLQSWDHSDYLRQRILDAGWCPKFVQLLHSGNLRVDNHFYFGSFRSPHEHTGCTTDTCSLESLQESDYSSKHATEGCQCEHITASDDVIVILKRGGIPFVRWQKSQISGQYELKAMEHDVGLNNATFVAISHV